MGGVDDVIVRYRVARRLERWEPYAFLLAWPFLFFGPYVGWWAWPIAFLPDALVWSWRKLWRMSKPRVATVTRSETSFGLDARDDDSVVVAFVDVVAATSVIDKTGRLTDLRIETKNRRPLIVEISGGEVSRDGMSSALVAKSLGVDDKTRSRFSISSLLAPRGSIFLVIGFVCVVWSWVDTPSPEIAKWMALYWRFVFIPLIVVYAIPTQFEVARDGVSWRWLFIRRYVSFADVDKVASLPANAATADKVTALAIHRRDGHVHHLILGQNARAVWSTVLAAFESRRTNDAAAQEAATTTANAEPALDLQKLDGGLARQKDESVFAWTKRLRAVSSREGYRHGSSMGSTKDLWELAENAATPVAKRCAALLIVVKNGAARERARVLATQIVDPNLFAFVEAVANDQTSDEALSGLVEKLVRNG